MVFMVKVQGHGALHAKQLSQIECGQNFKRNITSHFEKISQILKG